MSHERWLVSTFLLLCLAGCGGGLYPVEGIVQFDDGRPAKELAGGMVSLQGLDQDISSQGEIRGDGSFAISTIAQADGAMPGRYRVMITPPPTASESQRGAKPALDPIYSDAAKTPLEITVAAKRNETTLRVSRKSKSTK
jgi:hypothetical protein